MLPNNWQKYFPGANLQSQIRFSDIGIFQKLLALSTESDTAVFQHITTIGNCSSFFTLFVKENEWLNLQFYTLLTSELMDVISYEFCGSESRNNPLKGFYMGIVISVEISP